MRKIVNLKERLNHYGKANQPFFFCISYDMNDWYVESLDKLDTNIQFSLSSNNTTQHTLEQPKKDFIDFNEYKNQFDSVIEEIKCGNTYLLNLTASTTIETSYTLKDIYLQTDAKYKLFFKNKFVSFSPETFVTIRNNTISTHPMKGTIDATLENAKEKILQNQKELAEHTMIVDLLRNDLNLVSKNVRVENFRYIENIKAGEKELLQVSSHICGDLNDNWNEHIGDILIPMLPAGSISGTPKKMTLQIINNIENHTRDFFTGIWGIYDGKNLDSAVLIRFVENQNGKLIYKSGGGITLESDVVSEYEELNAKIYFP